MATITYDWGAFGFATYTPTTVPENISAVSLANASQILTDAISMDGKVAKEIALTIVAPNSVLTDDVTMTVLRQVGSAYQDPASGNDNFTLYTVPITQNQTTLNAYSFYAQNFDNFKIEIDNQSGVTLTVTLEMKDATVASV